jgi:hypothetical protein
VERTRWPTTTNFSFAVARISIMSWNLIKFPAGG